MGKTHDFGQFGLQESFYLFGRHIRNPIKLWPTIGPVYQ
jgi:hypothetical protein